MSHENITKLKDDYLKCLDISQNSATLNAEYIYENLKVVNEDGKVLEKDDLMPVVKMVEFIENVEPYEKFLFEKDRDGIEPNWAKEYDFGYKGIAIAYLDDIPKYKYYNVNLVMILASDFKNENGEHLITKYKIVMAKDTLTGTVY